MAGGGRQLDDPRHRSGRPSPRRAPPELPRSAAGVLHTTPKFAGGPGLYAGRSLPEKAATRTGSFVRPSNTRASPSSSFTSCRVACPCPSAFVRRESAPAVSRSLTREPARPHTPPHCQRGGGEAALDGPGRLPGPARRVPSTGERRGVCLFADDPKSPRTPLASGSAGRRTGELVLRASPANRRTGELNRRTGELDESRHFM